jgi:UDP-glucose 4-epimerase
MHASIIGHIVALRALKPGAAIYNLGTNVGLSVKEVIINHHK